MPQFHAIIPAGGVGNRLWPLSTEEQPKFLLDMDGSGRSMLEQTLRRCQRFSKNLTVVTGERYRDRVREIVENAGLKVPVTIFGEPTRKNSFAPNALAALVHYNQDSNCVVGSFAADHVVTDSKQFEQRVKRAIAVAQEGYMVTLGVKPRYASTQFGYCQRGSRLEDVDFKAYELEDFIEKPTKKRAKKYVSSGKFFWNGGMYISRASVLRKNVKRYMPDAYQVLCDIAEAFDTPEFNDVLHELWPKLPNISFDNAVAEPAAKDDRVAVVPTGKIGWDDMGDLEAVLRVHNIKGPVSISLDGTRVDVEAIEDDDREAVYIDTPSAQISTSRDTLGDIVHMRHDKTE